MVHATSGATWSDASVMWSDPSVTWSGAGAGLLFGICQVTDLAEAPGTTPPTVRFEGSFDVTGGPNGVAWDGTHLWIAVSGPDILRSYTTAGVAGSTITPPAPSAGSWQGVAWDGTHFWVGSDNTGTNILRIDTSGTQVDSFANPSSSSCLAWDGTYLWSGSPDDGRIRKLTTAGAVVSSFDRPASSFPQGLHWVGNDRMWVTVNNSNTVYLVDTTDGSVVRSITVPGGQASTTTSGTQGIAVVDGVAFIANTEAVAVYIVTGFGSA